VCSRADTPALVDHDTAPVRGAALSASVSASLMSAAGLADSTIASDVVHLEQVRAWFGRALWELEPGDADVYFGKMLRETAKGTRLSRAHGAADQRRRGDAALVRPGCVGSAR
jgi:hypothetical protein